MSGTILSTPSPMPMPEVRRRIFESVFPPNVSASVPTPLASPSTSFQPPPVLTHGYNTRHHPQPSSSPASDVGAVSLLPSPAMVLARESRAWHLATSFLSFPNCAFPATVREWIQDRGAPNQDAIEAIRYLVLSNEDGNIIDGRENLMEWYVSEVRRHFLGWVKPYCDIPLEVDNPAEVLENILAKLRTAQAIYLYQLKTYLLISQGDIPPRKATRRGPKKKGNTRKGTNNNDPRVCSFLRSLNSVISYSLPDPQWSQLVYVVFLELCGIAVGLSVDREPSVEDDGSVTLASDEPTEMDDSLYDKMPQSFATETDLDGDSILVASDEGDIIIPEEMDGIDDFDRYKRQPRGPKADARRKVLKLWEDMETLGIGGGGRRGERVYAEVINTLITLYIHQLFSEKWESPSVAAKELDEWVENILGRLIVDVLFSSTVQDEGGDARLDKLSPRESLRVCRESLDKRRRGGMDIDDGAGAGEEESLRRKEDLDSWKKIAIGRLGRLRVSELFDIVVDWPSSLGGVEDLKSYITTPQTRLHLTTTFSAALNTRILHPAAATSDVLAAYIRLIRAFSVLDPRGVLLDRVSRSIRRYLRDRDDTVKVIIRGVMSQSLPNSDSEDLVELASELSKGIPALSATSGGLEEMDYDDMNWVPDPVDAGPEFRRSKGLDVVGSLFSLYESKEVWIKEVQTILSARLLHDGKYDFEKEIRTVELLKLRFGDGTTQSADIMLKDVSDSKRVDGIIREMQYLQPHNAQAPDFHAKILSRLYWPQLKQETFIPPTPIQQIMSSYQQGFEQLKKKRKVDWMMTAGRVEVELELEDRMVVIPDATPAQAAVIYAFNDDGQEQDGEPKAMAYEQLLHELDMSEDTLRTALHFWIEKEVLVQLSPGVFTVVEMLDSAPGTPNLQQQPQQEEVVDVSEAERMRERLVFEPFIIAMLTNGGAMPTERIAMMLDMLLPGGFRWSGEELGELLLEMKENRRIEPTGQGWKAA